MWKVVPNLSNESWLSQLKIIWFTGCNYGVRELFVSLSLWVFELFWKNVLIFKIFLNIFSKIFVY